MHAYMIEQIPRLLEFFVSVLILALVKHDLLFPVVVIVLDSFVLIAFEQPQIELFLLLAGLVAVPIKEVRAAQAHLADQQVELLHHASSAELLQILVEVDQTILRRESG